MRSPRLRRSRAGSGFSLLEVLIALGLASIILGATLSSIAHDTVAVAQSSNRYQNMLWAGQALDVRMEQLSDNPTATTSDDPGTSSVGSSFKTAVSREKVTADPRVERVRIQVGDQGRSQFADGFRLTVRRPRSRNAAKRTSADPATPTGTTTGGATAAPTGTGGSPASGTGSAAGL